MMAEASQLRIPPVNKLVSGRWKNLPMTGTVTLPDNSIQRIQAKDLSSRTLVELEELLERQEKILKNEKFLLKLKDKGQKLKQKYEEISAALDLAKADQDESPSPILEAVPQDVNSLEWRQDGGRGVDAASVGSESDLEAEEREDVADPLQLFANHSQIPKKKENRKTSLDPGDLIRNELEKLSIEDSLAAEDPNQEGKGDHLDVSAKLFRKATQAEENQSSKQKFRPYKPSKEVQNKTNRERNPSLWEESSATGPILPTSTRPAQTLPLKESLIFVQKTQQLEKEKQLEAARMHLKDSRRFEIGVPSAQFKYRDVNTNRHILDESDDDDVVTTTF